MELKEKLEIVKTSCILTKRYTWCIIPSLIYFVSSLRWFPYSVIKILPIIIFSNWSNSFDLSCSVRCIFKIMRVWHECTEEMWRKISRYRRDTRESKCRKSTASLQRRRQLQPSRKFFFEFFSKHVDTMPGQSTLYFSRVNCSVYRLLRYLALLLHFLRVLFYTT